MYFVACLLCPSVTLEFKKVATLFIFVLASFLSSAITSIMLLVITESTNELVLVFHKGSFESSLLKMWTLPVKVFPLLFFIIYTI